MTQFLTAKQVGELLNCKPSTVYAWAKCGEIPCYKIGGLLRFDQAEIEEWIRQSKVSVSNTPDIRAKHIGDNDIDRIISGAIASEKESRYNSPTKGKPDQSGPGRR
jgi:excisionase family DNA binding protein